ncbi:Cyclin-D1-binding protein 1 [Wickerhamomyces ciferrii]|uniref:Cyclin-D1-binding protein 1 n=1 Tax=Wickerhamomyces ciferrii (strain ATCC 14091 / BCRC 22168 / CBS 111 / JCM 3599 / NBRC 0793 / NRRL Y-1031 F-60-10) TaxID=1206466 RepID=K0KE85_WICCF|nr:Cyclin-D1-binding protein 1 [Wickerhamomyces ciferrii]CCH43420.1 Cyclin-D1-binding protein 1 [Wickerhamomyces ciferrii]
MSTSEVIYNEEDLRKLITSFRESLELYLKALSSKESIDKIESSNVEDPSKEIIKISDLLFAHATKLGIVFKPKVSFNAAYKQLSETSSLFLFLLSLIPQIDPNKYSLIFTNELIDQIKKIISSQINFLNEVDVLDFNTPLEETEFGEKTEGRLLSVGVIWDNCKALKSLIQGGKLKLLENRLKGSIGLVDDAIEEFTEWLENPSIIDDEDPFGLGDDFTDEEDEDEETNKEVLKDIDPQIIEFGEVWNTKIKMIRLLISSLNKSLPSNDELITGKEADEFNKQQNGLIEQIDDLFSTIYINGSLFEIKKIGKNIEKQCLEIIKFVENLNKNDEKKTKWLNIWKEKFLQ